MDWKHPREWYLMMMAQKKQRRRHSSGREQRAGASMASIQRAAAVRVSLAFEPPSLSSSVGPLRLSLDKQDASSDSVHRAFRHHTRDGTLHTRHRPFQHSSAFLSESVLLWPWGAVAGGPESSEMTQAIRRWAPVASLPVASFAPTQTTQRTAMPSLQCPRVASPLSHLPSPKGHLQRVISEAAASRCRRQCPSGSTRCCASR